MMKKIEAGSKMDKLVKAFIAMRAIGDMAPCGGGLVGDLQKAYQLVASYFMKAAYDVGFDEFRAIQYCNDYLSMSKD